MTIRRPSGLATLVLGLLFLNATLPADAKEVEAKAMKGRGAGDAKDPNIKSSTETNKPNVDIPAPKDKGGTASRGVCIVKVDNRTSLIIKIFIDGTYRGAVSPWGDFYDYTLSGATRLYARADYDDGTYSYWGPSTVDCDPTYVWRLTR